MALAPGPIPEVLWRKPPVLALAALPGHARPPRQAVDRVAGGVGRGGCRRADAARRAVAAMARSEPRRGRIAARGRMSLWPPRPSPSVDNELHVSTRTYAHTKHGGGTMRALACWSAQRPRPPRSVPRHTPTRAHAASAPRQGALVAKVNMAESEFKFVLSAKTAPRGVVTFKVTNVGKVATTWGSRTERRGCSATAKAKRSASRSSAKSAIRTMPGAWSRRSRNERRLHDHLSGPSVSFSTT